MSKIYDHPKDFLAAAKLANFIKDLSKGIKFIHLLGHVGAGKSTLAGSIDSKEIIKVFAGSLLARARDRDDEIGNFIKARYDIGPVPA
jgi:ABC-type uncharacterized transport system ATPase component